MIQKSYQPNGGLGSSRSSFRHGKIKKKQTKQNRKQPKDWIKSFCRSSGKLSEVNSYQ